LALADEFGAVLRELRLNRGLSQEKLAFESGLDRTFISMLERGVRQPTLASIVALSNALGMRPSTLIQKFEKKSGL
jgi:transcriptional regulator with XRE-family HTH domain